MQKREAAIIELSGPPSRFLDNFQHVGEPTAVLCRIKEVGHTSVIIVSPRLSLNCAVGIYPAFASALREYSYSVLVPDDAFYKKFVEAFRREGMKLEQVPRDLFSPYANYGAYGAAKRLSRIGKRSPLGLGLDRRVEASFVQDSKVDAVMTHWTSQIREFGEEAFCAVDAETDALTANPHAGIDGVGEELRTQFDDHWALFANRFPDNDVEARAMQRLEVIVDQLEAGRTERLRVFVGYWVKRAPSLWVPRNCDPGGWKRLEMRSQIIRRLGKPWHYPTALDFLDGLSDKMRQGDDVKHDILEMVALNLQRYVAGIERKYPVILEDPIG